MSVWKMLVAAALSALAVPAWAGDLLVASTGAPVVVMRGAELVGTTPLTLADLPAGTVDLGFRDAPLSATAFTQRVTIPATGAVRLDVDLPARVATATAVAPAAPPTASASPATSPAASPASPPAPAPAPAKPPPPAGDIFVASTPAGATIYLDNAEIGQVTPFLVRAVAVGKHTVEARTACARGSTSLTVADQVIARADLTLTERPGSLAVSAGPPGTLVVLDGANVGTAPVAVKTVTCGQHALAIRAPGYLESTLTLDVHGDEAVNVAVGYGTVAPPPARAGTTVPLILKKEEFGTLVLDVTPLETTLAVDGVSVGAGPRSLEHVAAGPHTVLGTLDGHTPLTVEVTVAPDVVTRATLTLVPAPAAPAAPAPTSTTTKAGKKKEK